MEDVGAIYERLLDKGMSMKRIAEMHGTTRGAVAGRIRRYRTQTKVVKNREWSITLGQAMRRDVCLFSVLSSDLACGGKQQAGSVYCPEHYGVCYKGRI